MEGFTDIDPELQGEDRLRASIETNQHLLDAVHNSVAMREWLVGPGRGLKRELEQELFDAVKLWLSAHDPGSKQGRLAHFNARTALSVLQRLQLVVELGDEARPQLEAIDKELNGEPTDE